MPKLAQILKRSSEETERKFPIFGQDHGLITLEKCKFFDFALVFFYSLAFCLEHNQIVYLDLF